jgi:hypothetical protein
VQPDRRRGRGDRHADDDSHDRRLVGFVGRVDAADDDHDHDGAGAQPDHDGGTVADDRRTGIPHDRRHQG